MIELVAEQGYDAVKVGELAARAGVSTRDFYRCAQGKQECLLDIHDWIMEQATRRLAAAVEPGRNFEERSWLALQAIGDMLADHPLEARFACLDAAAAGLGILERKRRAAEGLAVLVAGCLGEPRRRPALPAPLLEGIVAGLSQVVRSLLLDGREAEFALLVPELHGWIAALTGGEAGRLPALVRRRPACASEAVPTFDFGGPLDPALAPEERERRQILAATLGLAAEAGYWRLTIPRIRAAVGISRARFDSHYDCAEDCFAAAIGLVAGRLMEFTAETAAGEADEWPRGFHHAIEALCAYTAREPMMARLVLVDILAAGPRGLRDLSALIRTISGRLRADLPRGARPAPVVAEASMGAVFTLVHRSITTRRLERLALLPPYLSYLILAPVLGPRSAIQAIGAECAEIDASPPRPGR